MSTSNPPTPLANVRKLRPWYLLLTMIVTGFMGLFGAFQGLELVRTLRSGTLVDSASVLGEIQKGSAFFYLAMVKKLALAQAVAEAVSRAFPLSVAQVIVCGLLFVASTAAMSGRRGAQSLALQAVVAVALFSVVEYMLTRGPRSASIEAVTRATQSLPAGLERDIVPENASWWWWWDRTTLVFVDLGPLVLAAIALTRPRSKAFFDAAARAAEAAADDDS